MHKLRDEPFDDNDEETFCLQTTIDIQNLLQLRNHGHPSKSLNTLRDADFEQSLEHLSMSIQNRLKVEAEEKKSRPKKPQNSITEQLSKFENVVKDISKQRIEE